MLNVLPGFARSYQVNARKSWYDENLVTYCSVFLRDKSRNLMKLKTKTVLFGRVASCTVYLQVSGGFLKFSLGK
ncbi:MAG: hypothetical protein MK132_24060 [Lentisphaerales bacterium]|nr:hypothetical protein [Lentisphaerales bacterium]